jgi:hypothetical protein
MRPMATPTAPADPIPDADRAFIDAIVSGRIDGDVRVYRPDGREIRRTPTSSLPGWARRRRRRLRRRR